MATSAKPRHQSPYFQEIRESLARLGYLGVDPRHVEAAMRCEYGTLDHLTRAKFDAEVSIGAMCALHDPKGAEDLAQSYGL